MQTFICILEERFVDSSSAVKSIFVEVSVSIGPEAKSVTLGRAGLGPGRAYRTWFGVLAWHNK